MGLRFIGLKITECSKALHLSMHVGLDGIRSGGSCEGQNGALLHVIFVKY